MPPAVGLGKRPGPSKGGQAAARRAFSLVARLAISHASPAAFGRPKGTVIGGLPFTGKSDCERCGTMAEIVSLRPSSLAMRLVFGFIAGFFATLTLHAAALAILHALGVTPAFPYGMKPTWPLGVPQEVSLAFWGGVWGVIFSAARPYPRNIAGYWLGAIFLARSRRPLSLGSSSSHCMACRWPEDSTSRV
jgi:hypothetical protein